MVSPAFDAASVKPGEFYEQRLGQRRAHEMNPFGSLSRAGVPLAFCTDAPVTPIAVWATVSAPVKHSPPAGRLRSGVPTDSEVPESGVRLSAP